MKIIALILSGVAVAISAGSYMNTRHTHTEVNTQQLSSKIEQLQSRLDNVIEQINLAGTEKPMTQEHPLIAGPDLSSLEQRIVELERVLPLLESLDQRGQQDEMMGLLTTNPGEFSRRKAQDNQQQTQLIDSRFASEEVDTIWANSALTYIESALLKPELSHGQVDSAECKSTMCRLELSYQDNDANKKMAFETSLLLELSNKLPGSVIRPVKNSNGQRSEVILVRAGNRLPSARN